MPVNGAAAEGADAERVIDSGAGGAAVVGRPLFAQRGSPQIIRSGVP